MGAPLASTRLRTQSVLRLTLAWSVVGLVTALFEHAALLAHGVPSTWEARIDERFLPTLLAGLFGGGAYFFLVRRRLRGMAFLPAFGLMAALVLAVVAVTGALWPALRNAGPWWDNFAGRFFSLAFLAQYLYWALLMGATMLIMRSNDQYGGRGMAYLTGRYHKPRQEMRVFMFLDMRSSTAIAERLGHVKYFQLLNSLFTDITDPIINARGGIYQYVGDEISVSWPLRRGISRHRCVRCFLDIRAKMRRRAPYYRQRFGIEPVFKAGLHYGPITTGEVGVLKRERIYSGDVVNTTARIQESCNEHGVDNLISQDLLDVLNLPPDKFAVREIGSIALQGKSRPTRLWTIEQGPGH
ncbi:MAG: adenylate/guanylate cyclase domain-containing protein [Flavobacteriales bacterium]|jgi:adenylate cyclase|nr:adenylate/guanylate cyclase domain-containing protein [Flavobacteriales bacterium]